MAGPLWADSVSNLSLGGEQGPTVTSTFPSAQGFTTGSKSSRYTLASVTLKLADARATTDILTLSLYSATTGGKPNASLTVLNPPSNDISSAANYTFTCSTGCQLAGDNTSYFIVLEVGGAMQYYWYQDSAITQTNTPAGGGWEIADVAQYNNRGTWTDESPAVVKLMQVSYIGPDLLVENISQTEADLKLRNWGGGTWSYKMDFTGSGRESCTPVRRGTHVSLSLANAGSEYTVSAHRGSTCGEADLLDTETFTTLADGVKRPLLSVSGVGSTSATLNLADHTGDWWYQRYRIGGTGVCTKVDSGTYSASLSNLTANKAYSYAAYSHAGCKEASVPITWISTVSFNTTGSISATVADNTDSQVTLTVTGIDDGHWSYTYRNENTGKFSDCGSFDASTTSVVASGLKSGTPYTFRVYRGSSCNWDDRVTVNAHTISLSSDQVGSTSATLTLNHHEGAWYHQQAGGQAGAQAGGCSTAVNGATANLTGLTPETDYTWKAYKAEGCADADAIASTSFTTATAGTHPPTGGEPDQVEAEVEADLQPTFGAHTIDNQAYEPHQAIGTLQLPAASGGNGPLTYALTPALPAGLTFDAATRTLRGTPTGARPATTYTYTATDADASEPDVARLTFTIEVVLSAAEQAILEDGLAAQGRALLSGATGVIGERFRTPGASSVAGAGLAACLGQAGPGTDDAGDAETEPECATGLLTTVAQAMLGLSGAGGHTDPWGMADADETRLRGPGLGNGSAQPAWDWESLIWGRSFALPLNAQGTPGSAWTLWGAGDIQGFEGSPRQGRYDGQVRSLYLGVDAQWQAQWLAGAALAQSWGKTDYVAEPGGSAGQVETTLTSVYPYVRGTLGSGLEVWAIGGYGRGEAEQTQADGAGDTRDLTMAMGATGVRQPMTEVGGAQVALVGGAGYLSLATEEGNSTIADLDVAVNRARLAVEAAWTAGGLAPYVQVGGRYDGGAGQTGAGLETVAGVRYTSERLEFEARGRWLAAHAADGYTEYGGLARLAVKPQADGTGFRMAVAPRWGAVGDAGLLGGGAALLDGGAMPGLGVNGMPAATTRALMLESELGYGVAVFEGHGILTPYGGFAFTGNETRQYRLGARLGMAQWLNLSLEGTRREATGPQPADQGVQLQFQGRF